MKRMMAVLLAAVCLLSGCALTGQQTTTAPAVPIEMDAASVFRTMFAVSDCIAMELHFADGTAYGPYFSYSLPRELKLEADKLTEIPAVDLSGYTEWLTVGAKDGSVRLTVYRGSPDVLCYQEGGAYQYYQAPENTEQTLREVFDRAQKQTRGRISFFSGRSGKAILDAYAETALPSYLYEMAPGSMYRIKDYEARSVKLDGKTGKVLLGTVTFAVKPDRPDIGQVPELGTFKKAEDGWCLYEKQIFIEHQEDGKWHEISAGDHHAVNTAQYPPYDPAKVEPRPAATEFLEALPQELPALQKASDEATLVELAETFLQTTTAVPLSGSTDFDWKQFFTEGALRNTGVRALLKTMVDCEGATGYFKGYLSGELKVDTVVLGKDSAKTANDQIQLYFTKTGGKWLISDISMF